jgi:hypothetical protein
MKLFKRWREMMKAAEQLDAMSERLFEAQTQIEVMADALEQKDKALLEFVGRLHENMGGDLKLDSEAAALSRLRVIREQAERFTAIMDVVEGRYGADEQLLKRVACALGTSNFSAANVISRASQLAGAHLKVIQLERQVASMQQELDEAENILDNEWRTNT